MVGSVAYQTITVDNIFELEPEFEILDYETPKTTQMFTAQEEDEMAEKNMMLVHSITNKWANGRTDRDDIFSAAEQGLCKAIQAFDPRTKNAFSTFAHKVITNEIVYYLRQANRVAKHCVSMETLISADSNGHEIILEDILGVDDDMQRDVAHQEVLHIMHLYIDKFLSEDEKKIIRCRFGLDTKTMTQLEVARLLHMSQANVSKRERHILAKLRIMMKAKLGENIEL